MVDHILFHEELHHERSLVLANIMIQHQHILFFAELRSVKYLTCHDAQLVLLLSAVLRDTQYSIYELYKTTLLLVHHELVMVSSLMRAVDFIDGLGQILLMRDCWVLPTVRQTC